MIVISTRFQQALDIYLPNAERQNNKYYANTREVLEKRLIAHQNNTELPTDIWPEEEC